MGTAPNIGCAAGSWAEKTDGSVMSLARPAGIVPRLPELLLPVARPARVEATAPAWSAFDRLARLDDAEEALMALQRLRSAHFSPSDSSGYGLRDDLAGGIARRAFIKAHDDIGA